MSTTKNSLASLPMRRKVEALSRLASLAERVDKKATVSFNSQYMTLSFDVVSKESQLFDGSKFFDMPSLNVSMTAQVDYESLQVFVGVEKYTAPKGLSEFVMKACDAMANKLATETEKQFKELNLMPYTRGKEDK